MSNTDFVQNVYMDGRNNVVDFSSDNRAIDWEGMFVPNPGVPVQNNLLFQRARAISSRIELNPDDRPSSDEVFLTMAYLVAARSTCKRRQVGCVITDWTGEQVAVGYNGGPRGGRNTCAREGVGLCGCIHAEINACIKANFSGDRVAYVTISPCELCAVALVNAHVKRCVVGNVYSDEVGLDVLRDSGCDVVVTYPEVLQRAR